MGSKGHPSWGDADLSGLFYTIQDHGDIQAWAASEDHVWVHGHLSALVCGDVHDPCDHQGSNRSPGSGSLLVTMVEMEGCAMAGAMMIWEASTANVVSTGPELFPWAMSRCVALLQLGSTSMTVVWVATKSNADTQF